MAAVHPNPLLPPASASAPPDSRSLPVEGGPAGFAGHDSGYHDITSNVSTLLSSNNNENRQGLSSASLPELPTISSSDSLWQPPANSIPRPQRTLYPFPLPADGNMGISLSSSFPKNLKVDDFARIRTLGTGTFARVALVRRENPRNDDEARQVFALKILRKAAVIKLKQIDHVRNERQILKDVGGHPFITHLLASFSDRDFLYLLLDYVPGGELFSYLRKHRRFDESTARFYAAEIVLVLEYLHEEQDGIAYRDLKPENLLLDARGHVKLVDFGFAKRLGRGANGALETYTMCGTPEYIAPEVIQNMGHTTAVDWWALGILIYEFLTGYPPFWHQNPLEIYRQVLERAVVFPQDPSISPAAQDIVQQLCRVDRSRRLGNISGGAAKVKEHPFFEGVDWDAVYAQRDKGPIIPPVRYVGDAQCFDIYPENDVNFDVYTEEQKEQYDSLFDHF